MKKETFYFDSRDGKTKIYATSWSPEQPTPLCIVQIVHGMNEYIDRYEALAQYLTDRGVLVVGDDHLGHGHSVPEGGTFGYFCEQDAATVLVRDEHRLKKIMEEKYPTVPYILLGHSMGSFIVRNYLTKYGTGIAGAIICGTGTPKVGQLIGGKLLTGIIGKVKGSNYVSKLVDDISSKEYMSGIEGAKSEYDWLCTDEEVLKTYAKDPFCAGFTFTVNGYHTLYELAHRMQKKENMLKIPKKLPLLIVSGTEDPVGNMGLAPKQLYDSYLNLDLTKVTLKLYNGARHELLNEKIKESVYIDLFSWIEMTVMEVSGK